MTVLTGEIIGVDEKEARVLVITPQVHCGCIAAIALEDCKGKIAVGVSVQLFLKESDHEEIDRDQWES